MKQFQFIIPLVGLLLLVSACGGKDEVSDRSAHESDASETSLGEDSLKHDSDEPFLFPFGLEIKDFKETGYRERCGGDCCSGIKVIEKGEYAIFLDTTDCWEYGYSEKYLLFRGEELIACHVKSFDMGEIGEDFVFRERMERTIDFENEKVFARRDTVKNSVKKWMNQEFQAEPFTSKLKGEVLNFVLDPRERVSFDSKTKISLYHQGRDGMLSSIVLSNNKTYQEEDIVVTEGYMLQEISDKKAMGIPKDAVFAYTTWYAGSGEILYGKLNNGVLRIYRSFEDESLSEIPPFELLLEVDPDFEGPAPDHYIIFNSAKNGKNKLMIAFDENDFAQYAKYEGQSRQIELKFKSEKSSGKKIIRVYTELIHGIPNGTYTHTHDGVWDYITYKGNSGNEAKFNINHDLTTPEGSAYRKKPLF